MRIVDLYLESIQAADWNPNQLDGADLDRLRQSIQRFGLVAPLVVRSIGEDVYETIGGAQRLSVLRELGIEAVPCVIVEADDVEARLLSQCLNRIAGSDDLGLKAELLRKVLAELPQQEVLRVLPESAESLQALASLGQQDLAGYLQNYPQAQSARLRRLTFPSTPAQLAVIEEALARVMPQAGKTPGDNPNPRGNALYLLCKSYLELTGRDS
ncbi:MAG TPA: ParB N-terminal domain-containing protein [Dehalococcoidia bacterium]|jgi:ParB family chromosome partitioning protein|nr:ParB N-terminal domain-containing protein [Dehalococcoidia bacterium]